MQRIYIDVTNLTKTQFLTGIQRVVRNVSVELYKVIPDRLCFLAFDDDKKCFTELNTDNFVGFIQRKKVEAKDIFTQRTVRPEDMNPGDVYFELDSVWNNSLRRSTFLPELKHYGVRIAVYIYDIIPVTYPEYPHENTRFNFLNYLGAYLQYADILIVSAQSTLDEIYELTDRLELPRIPGYVSWLGSDFSKGDKGISDENVPKEVKEAASKRYILNIGTIEPRKNHTLLLDAFDEDLFDKDINLIFAGKIGWNIEDLKKRIENHPKKDSQFFHFTGLSDEAIEFLYENAYMVAFPTFAEGFGLPIVESLQRGTPVLASDIPVLREVGGEYCDYFNPKDYREFVKVVNKFLDNQEDYEALKKKAEGFIPFTWKETADRILTALGTLSINEYKAKNNVSQMVILTARVDDIKNTIPYIEKYMPFIEKLLLCCPENAAKDMTMIETKRLTIETLTDEEILNGRELPKDHGTRNFFLRCLAMQSDKVDEVFIMSDDDYRPLKEISLDIFVKDDCYNAYYCHDLNEWKGVVGNLSSYDRYIYRTRDFLNENKYPGLQYSSHMPQIIDKELYREMIEKHTGIENMGLDEWSSYFNYVRAKYPNLVKSKPYLTMKWPGRITDWNMFVKPEELMFENHYDFLYAQGEIFEKFSNEISDKVAEENEMKIKLADRENDLFFEGKKHFLSFESGYIKDNLERISFSICCENETVRISTPGKVELMLGTATYLPFTFKGETDGLSINLSVTDGKRTLCTTPFYKLNSEDLKYTDGKFEINLLCTEPMAHKGNCTLEIGVERENERFIRKIPVKII